MKRKLPTATDSGRLPAADPAILAILNTAAPGSVRARATDRLGLAHDASHYLLTPQAVLVPRNAEQVATLMRAGAELGLAVTFRSGGTSLSGQAGTEHLLLDVRRHFRAIEVLAEGANVRAQPGAVLRQVNARLAPYGRKLGPDPASESACTIGGVIANNSSGMTCGTHANAYRTIESMTLVLASGTVIDTAAADADARLRALEPELTAALEQLRHRIRDKPESVRRITEQFAMKNTMGYGLNSFLDHTSPAQILAHLIIGSEGTLGVCRRGCVPNRPGVPARDDRARHLPHAARGDGSRARVGDGRSRRRGTPRRRVTSRGPDRSACRPGTARPARSPAGRPARRMAGTGGGAAHRTGTRRTTRPLQMEPGRTGWAQP